MNKKVIKIVLIILLSIMIPLMCCGGYLFVGCYYTPMIWEWEMDEEMDDWLKENFELILPEKYEYIEGKESWGVIYLHFEMDEDDFFEMMNKEVWKQAYGTSDIEFIGKEYKELTYYAYENSDDSNVGYIYYKQEDSKIHCYMNLFE